MAHYIDFEIDWTPLDVEHAMAKQPITVQHLNIAPKSLQGHLKLA